MDGRDKTENVDESAAEATQDSDQDVDQEIAQVEPALETGAESDADAASDAEQPDDAAQLKDQLFRALADAENARRRAKKDVEEARRYANTNFARDLLAVADNMSRALGTISTEARAADAVLDALAEGIEMTARELEATFTRHGIKRIDPKGEKFDYNQHQAMFETSDTDQPDGTVVEVAQVGYILGDRLLRPAMVGVAKGGKAAGAANGLDADDSGAERGEHVDTSA